MIKIEITIGAVKGLTTKPIRKADVSAKAIAEAANVVAAAASSKKLLGELP